MKKVLIPMLIVVLLLGGCDTTPTPVATRTQTPLSAATPTATPTPTPRATPAPTPIPSPTVDEPEFQADEVIAIVKAHLESTGWTLGSWTTWSAKYIGKGKWQVTGFARWVDPRETSAAAPPFKPTLTPSESERIRERLGLPPREGKMVKPVRVSQNKTADTWYVYEKSRTVETVK